VPWSSIASGGEDGYIAALADGFKTLGPSFFVFDGEPEAKVGDRGSAEEYRAAWRHIHEVFRARGADNVAFMWSMTGYAFQAESGQLALAASLYPGDDVTDWIAVDPYNFFEDGTWHSLSTEMGPWYRWVRANHPDKPLALSEWGSKEDPDQPGRKAAWFAEALRDLRTQYRAVKAVVYFDEEKHERGTVNDWRIDTSDSSLRAFGEVARSKWFNPTVRSRK
jgi:beta-mannanase